MKEYFLFFLEKKINWVINLSVTVLANDFAKRRSHVNLVFITKVVTVGCGEYIIFLVKAHSFIYSLI